MPETWLRTNSRAITLGMIPPGLAALVGAALAGGAFGGGELLAVRVVGIALVAVGTLLVLALARWLSVPRIAYDDGRLLLSLRFGPPIRLPIDLVEAFLLGQGPAMLPGKRHQRTEARMLTLRIAERARDWADVEVKPALGRWCGGYVTIHGAWCEPLSVALVNELNERLAEAKQQRAAARSGAAP